VNLFFAQHINISTFIVNKLKTHLLMKIKFLSTLAFLCIVSLTVIYSCKKKNKDKTNADYAGAWSVSEHCTGNASYNMTITATGTDGVTLTNFHGGFTVTGTVSNITLTIPTQTVTSATMGGPYKFSGSGTLSSDAHSLSITYTMTDNSGSNPLNCTSTCTK